VHLERWGERNSKQEKLVIESRSLFDKDSIDVEIDWIE
jgi:hypothetical protein